MSYVMRQAVGWEGRQEGTVEPGYTTAEYKTGTETAATKAAPSGGTAATWTPSAAPGVPTAPQTAALAGGGLLVAIVILGVIGYAMWKG